MTLKMILYHNLCGLGLKINSRPPHFQEKIPHVCKLLKKLKTKVQNTIILHNYAFHHTYYSREKFQ